MRALLSLLLFTCLTVPAAVADATGTVRVQQADGEVKVYHDVHISIANKSMSITSGDRKGTIVISKAACSMVGELMRCFPYAAELNQDGGVRKIVMQNGTVWLNRGNVSRQLPHSSTQLSPHGVLVSIRTKAGTYFSLNGIVDELKQ